MKFYGGKRWILTFFTFITSFNNREREIHNYVRSVTSQNRSHKEIFIKEGVLTEGYTLIELYMLGK